MRRVAIFTAGAALVLGSLAIPGMAVATGRTTTPDQSTTISPQSVSLDTPIAAQGKGHGRHGRSHGYRHGRSRHGHGHRWLGFYGPGFYGPGYGYWGYGYGGGYWPGPRGYGYGGFWRGGFGCNFDYPCGPPFDEKCRSFRGAPSADPRCQAQKTEPAPGQSAQPTPDTGTQPAPAPAPEQGGTQPRPY